MLHDKWRYAPCVPSCRRPPPPYERSNKRTDEQAALPGALDTGQPSSPYEPHHKQPYKRFYLCGSSEESSLGWRVCHQLWTVAIGCRMTPQIPSNTSIMSSTILSPCPVLSHNHTVYSAVTIPRSGSTNMRGWLGSPTAASCSMAYVFMLSVDPEHLAVTLLRVTRVG